MNHEICGTVAFLGFLVFAGWFLWLIFRGER